jgi:molybdopterin converting factor small subunit
MPGSAHSNVAVIRATLGHDYGLDHLEVEILTEDVVDNLKALCEDIEDNDGKPDEENRFKEAVEALRNMAANLRQERLVATADTIVENSGNRKLKAYRTALKDLREFVDKMDAAIDTGPHRRRGFGIRHGTRPASQNHVPGRGR